MARIELRDGQWAELRDHINHKTDKGIWLARKRAIDAGVTAEGFGWKTLLTRLFVRSWSVKDPDGAPITITPIDLTDDDPVALAREDLGPIDHAPDDIVNVLYKAAAEAWVGTTVPNAPTPLSSDGSSSD
jgi:hypothetical protein